jgi:hypothetical protein
MVLKIRKKTFWMMNCHIRAKKVVNEKVYLFGKASMCSVVFLQGYKGYRENISMLLCIIDFGLCVGKEKIKALAKKYFTKKHALCG